MDLGERGIWKPPSDHVGPDSQFQTILCHLNGGEEAVEGGRCGKTCVKRGVYFEPNEELAFKAFANSLLAKAIAFAKNSIAACPSSFSPAFRDQTQPRDTTHSGGCRTIPRWHHAELPHVPSSSRYQQTPKTTGSLNAGLKD